MTLPHPSGFLGNEFVSSGELEQVLLGAQGQPLLHYPQSKYFTVVPRPLMLFGVYNRINYTSACFNSCWLANKERGPRTKSLFCVGGGFSRCGSVFAFLLSLILSILPFAAVWPFFFKPNYYGELLICTTSLEFVLFVWHVYTIYIIKTRNLEIWLNSWFTFCVKTEALKDETNSSKAHSFYSLCGKLRVVDVSVSDLCRLNSALHEITATERDNLAAVVESHRFEQAVVILYSEQFLKEFFICSLFGISLLAALSAASTAVLTWKTLITKL